MFFNEWGMGHGLVQQSMGILWLHVYLYDENESFNLPVVPVGLALIRLTAVLEEDAAGDA